MIYRLAIDSIKVDALAETGKETERRPNPLSRACGSATPLPTPVDPSSSRLAICSATSSAVEAKFGCGQRGELAQAGAPYHLPEGRAGCESEREKVSDLH